MRADNEFLIALMNKLQEIANNTTDINTQEELNDFIESIALSLS